MLILHFLSLTIVNVHRENDKDLASTDESMNAKKISTNFYTFLNRGSCWKQPR